MLLFCSQPVLVTQSFRHRHSIIFLFPLSIDTEETGEIHSECTFAFLLGLCFFFHLYVVSVAGVDTLGSPTSTAVRVLQEFFCTPSKSNCSATTDLNSLTSMMYNFVR